MGAIAEAIVAYAQPLIEKTDGSLEQMNKAMSIAQLCWNLALCPQDEREQMLNDMQPSLESDDNLFNELRQSIIEPMIQRHQEMFPFLHSRDPLPNPLIGRSPLVHSRAAGEAFPGAKPYEPCPCNSGRKYKFCCKSKRG